MRLSKITAGITLLGIAAIIFYFFNKNVNASENTSIKPAIEGIDIPFNKHVIIYDKEVVIEEKTGTQLTIPARCFRRADGTEPKDSVTLQVREMHDPYSILLSGIPMQVAGTESKHLESGGMIEIRAFEKEEELVLKEGQSIGIELAAFKKEDSYNLYYLNDEAVWNVKDSFIQLPNERKQKKIDALTKEIKKYKDSLNPESFVFVIDGDTSLNPELKPFIGQEWLLLENDKIESAKMAMRHNWSKVEIAVKNRRRMEYKIRFRYEEDVVEKTSLTKTYELIAQPMMDERNSKRKNRRHFSEKMREYELLVKQNEEELERVKLQAELVNSFQANNMGVWNIDKIMQEEVIITKAEFDFEHSLKGPQKEHFVYMIMEENNSVVKIHRYEWSKFPFPRNKRFSIVAVLTNGTIASVGYDELQRKLKPGQTQVLLTSEKKSANQFIETMPLMAKR
jgi:hypothetical protein